MIGQTIFRYKCLVLALTLLRIGNTAASDLLDKAVRMGGRCGDWLARDEDRAALRDGPRFQNALCKIHQMLAVRFRGFGLSEPHSVYSSGLGSEAVPESISY
jgi:hypothetical protein